MKRRKASLLRIMSSCKCIDIVLSNRALESNKGDIKKGRYV